MSLLFARLLHEAEAQLAAGDAAAAETTCCQVLSGAVTLKNADLVCAATQLLRRIPQTDELQRRTSIWHLSNLVASMQNGTDREGALLLCDALLHATEGLLYDHLNALNLALYITGGYSMARERHPSYHKYLDELIRYERQGLEAAETDEIEFEQNAAAGPGPAARALAKYGSVLVRGLFDGERLAPWRDGGLRFFASDPHQAAKLAEIGDPVALLDGAPRQFLDPLLRHFFFFEPALNLANSFVRRVEAQRRETAVPFHQDVNAFGHLMINVWTPLVACGRDAPELEVVTRRTPTRIETAEAHSQYNELQITEELVREQFGEAAIVSPEMAPGDVLILLGTTIHRTYARPEMSEARLSLELRFSVT